MHSRQHTISGGAICAGAAVALSLRVLSLAAGEPPSVDAQSIQSATQFFRWALVESLPAFYEKRDNWGAQHHLLIEHRLRFDGLEPKLEKRTRQVNHGLWRMYRITPLAPAEKLDLRIDRVESLPGGRAKFRVILVAPLHAEARQERWRYGVKLLNFSLEANAVVEARLACELGLKTEGGEIVIEPKIAGAELELRQFELRRFSQIDGDLARELGKLLEDIVAKEVAERGPKVAEKLNQSISKRQQRLRFSPAEAISDTWRQAAAALGLAAPTTPPAMPRAALPKP